MGIRSTQIKLDLANSNLASLLEVLPSLIAGKASASRKDEHFHGMPTCNETYGNHNSTAHWQPSREIGIGGPPRLATGAGPPPMEDSPPFLQRCCSLAGKRDQVEQVRIGTFPVDARRTEFAIQ